MYLLIKSSKQPWAGECFYPLYMDKETKGQRSEVDLLKDTVNEWQGWDFNPWVYQEKLLAASLFINLPTSTMFLFCSELFLSSPATQGQSQSSCNGL